MKIRLKIAAIIAVLAIAPALYATVDDALSFAYEAATPYVKQGYTFREDAWGGDLGVGEQKAVTAQLFKGNEYWFCLGTDVDKANVTVHVYDAKGKLVQSEPKGGESGNWQKGRFAGTYVNPPQTGTYYAIVEVKKSPEERTHWALVYGYR